jgi:phosphoribosylaminoimidazolecarboxamide formyltransferase/IMP cyclohydrolase
MKLKYGANPHQAFANAEPIGKEPLKLLNGKPSIINLLDALNAWQLVSELKTALDLPAAASFKHVSPAGAALAIPLSDDLAEAYGVRGMELTPTALAYVRARGADPKSSFGDFVALSERVDVPTARFLKAVVSDGIVAPGYEPAALELLKQKKSGGFIVLESEPGFEAPTRETREVFGVRLTQDRNTHVFSKTDLNNVVCGKLSEEAIRDLVLGLTTLKYTQSNSVGYAQGGQMIGIGAGQQSRVDCTKLAGSKADLWQLRRHPKVLGLSFKESLKKQDRVNWTVRYIEGDLVPFERDAFADALAQPANPLTEAEKQAWLEQVDDVCLVSDGFIPFRDNVDHAKRHGVRFIAQPGGSARDTDVTQACKSYGIAMAHTAVRAFHH